MPITREIRFISSSRTSQRSPFDDNLEYSFSANPTQGTTSDNVPRYSVTSSFFYLVDRSTSAKQRN